MFRVQIPGCCKQFVLINYVILIYIPLCFDSFGQLFSYSFELFEAINLLHKCALLCFDSDRPDCNDVCEPFIINFDCSDHSKNDHVENPPSSKAVCGKYCQTPAALSTDNTQKFCPFGFCNFLSDIDVVTGFAIHKSMQFD